MLQLPANMVREAAQEDQSAWYSTTYVIDLGGVSGSWLQTDPALAIPTIWKVNQHLEDLYFSISL